MNGTGEDRRGAGRAIITAAGKLPAVIGATAGQGRAAGGLPASGRA